jgi:aromatic ring-opening dioxygenase LigB subunit
VTANCGCSLNPASLNYWLMGIVYACIAPHGAELIPKLAGKQLAAFDKTRKAMEKLATAMEKYKPSTIIVATPHSVRLDCTIGVVTTEYSGGRLTAHGKSVTARFQCDRPLAHRIIQEARRLRLPVIGVNYGTSEGSGSCMPMDWGTLIPLWFFGPAHDRERQSKLVIVTPSREIPVAQLVRFGSAVARAADLHSGNVAFVASADQGHAHDKSGPYGFSPASAQHDKFLTRAIKHDNLKRILEFDAHFIDEAKPDSLWQMAMLIGVIEQVPMRARFISYQAPTYYGMLCADFEPC